jgi:hypothetical protein
VSDEPEREPSDEQRRLAEQLAEELRKLKVEDIVIQALVQISSIGYRRLGLAPGTEGDRDLDQARLAIETMRALVPVLGQVVPAELVRQFEDAVADLQLAYAAAVKQAGAKEEPAGE